MQLWSKPPIRMQVTPLDIQAARMFEAMYSMDNQRAPMYPKSPYAGMSGLGDSIPPGFTTAPLGPSDVARYMQMGFIADPNSVADTPAFLGSLQLYYLDPNGNPIWLLSPAQQNTATKNAAWMQANPGQPLPNGVMLTQAQASAITGSPNQSVPPQTPLTPLSTGGTPTAAQILAAQQAAAAQGTPSGGTQQQTPPSDNTSTYLLIGAAVIGGLFLMRNK
jgi:hypothetical protein